ncbi:hypothetical protein NBRC116601_25500 [Cognatishimia sp. WU-CL00825]|uniref:ATP-binding protein n=1 Tax=Cognatishimia sp. WU-CL00825 TaxID=3127658 RepID=UPI0031035F01
MPKIATINYHSLPHAQIADVRKALCVFRSELHATGINKLTVSSMEIVLAEILNNIVEHGIGHRPDGWFCIECRTGKSVLQFHIRDNGTAMPNGTLPLGLPPNINRPLHKMPEGGWGWSLVHALAENLTYLRKDHINHVTYRIPIIISK